LKKDARGGFNDRKLLSAFPASASATPSKIPGNRPGGY
jgi:hypothetical protein